MIDHAARAEVRQLVDEFLLDRIGAFAFDDKLQKIAVKTNDQTVRIIVRMLWNAYSDVDDHLVRLDKAGWDTIQRLLLLLESGAELRRDNHWMWHSSQLVAALTLVVVVAFVWINAPAMLIAGGIISITLASIRRQARAAVQSIDLLNAWPFPNLGAIQSAIKRAPAFRKHRYRRGILERGRRSRLDYFQLPQIIEWPLSRLGWCLVSPLVLLFQCLPIWVTEATFREPENELPEAA